MRYFFIILLLLGACEKPLRYDPYLLGLGASYLQTPQSRAFVTCQEWAGRVLCY